MFTWDWSFWSQPGHWVAVNSEAELLTRKQEIGSMRGQHWVYLKTALACSVQRLCFSHRCAAAAAAATAAMCLAQTESARLLSQTNPWLVCLPRMAYCLADLHSSPHNSLSGGGTFVPKLCSILLAKDYWYKQWVNNINNTWSKRMR